MCVPQSRCGKDEQQMQNVATTKKMQQAMRSINVRAVFDALKDPRDIERPSDRAVDRLNAPNELNFSQP